MFIIVQLILRVVIENYIKHKSIVLSKNIFFMATDSLSNYWVNLLGNTKINKSWCKYSVPK